MRYREKYISERAFSSNYYCYKFNEVLILVCADTKSSALFHRISGQPDITSGKYLKDYFGIPTYA